MKKRLFLFAGYDKDGIVGSSLLWYIKALSSMGDVVFVADSFIPGKELDKLSQLCLHCQADPHGEYDFGSYKRGYMWAKANANLESYDYIYMVNDSVYGPLFDLRTYVIQMEALGSQAFSFVLNPNPRHIHLQSWFLAVDRSVFTQPWFEEFILSVRKEKSKLDICVKYETGLTSLLKSKDISFDAILKLSGRKIYNSVRKLYLMEFPFIKKSAFIRHNGSLGAQLSYVLDNVSEECRKVILEDASRCYGEKYIASLLTRNPFVIASRYMAYLSIKLGLRRSA